MGKRILLSVVFGIAWSVVGYVSSSIMGAEFADAFKYAAWTCIPAAVGMYAGQTVDQKDK